jgi:hypothetical protein
VVSSISKTDRHYISEILLKVALNTITLTLKFYLKVRQPTDVDEKKRKRKKKGNIPTPWF